MATTTRLYLSPVFKDTEGLYSGTLKAWHHRLQTDHPGVPYSGGEIRTSQTTGVPTEQAVLVAVDAEDHAPFENNPNLIALSDLPLDAVAEPLTPTEKLERIGYARVLIDLVWGGGRTVREVLNFYGRLNNPDFDVDRS